MARLYRAISPDIVLLQMARSSRAMTMFGGHGSRIRAADIISALVLAKHRHAPPPSPHRILGGANDVAQVAGAARDADDVEILQHDNRQITADTGLLVEFGGGES